MINLTRIRASLERLDRALATSPHTLDRARTRAWLTTGGNTTMAKSTTLTIRVSPDELDAIDRYAQDLASGSPVTVTRSEAARAAIVRGLAAPQEWAMRARTDAGTVHRTFPTRDALQAAWIAMVRSNATREIVCHRDGDEIVELRYDREGES